MKKFFVHTLLLVAVLGTAFTAKSQTADEIINKYVDAIGGKENWKKMVLPTWLKKAEIRQQQMPKPKRI